MKSLEQIAIEYAKNRAEFRKVKSEIQELLWPIDKNGRLVLSEQGGTLKDKMDKYFKNWFDCGDYECGVSWPDGGWITVVDESDETDPDVIRLASLWEQRKTILREAGKIKRAFWARGAMLLRQQEQT